jgi:hypothetical protein
VVDGTQVMPHFLHIPGVFHHGKDNASFLKPQHTGYYGVLDQEATSADHVFATSYESVSFSFTSIAA